VLLYAKLNVITNWCNRGEMPLDTPETLWLEVLFTACVKLWVKSNEDETKIWDTPTKLSFPTEYAEFLDLPIDLYCRSPLRLSIGHKHHHFSMTTG
jgi:hypothetical protein